MKFGYFDILCDLTKARPYVDLVEDYRRIGEICEESGFDVIWFGEHHFSVWGREITPNPVLLAADFAARTKRLRIGLGAAIITFWHPLRLAEDIAVLDHLSNGRLELGVGRGNYGLEALNLNPIADPNDPQKNFDVFAETLHILKKAFAGSFSHKGAYYRFPAPGFTADKAHTVDDPEFVDPETNELVKIAVVPRPLQQPLPMWTVGTGDPTIKFAAENDCGIIMWRATVAELKRRLGLYRQAYQGAHGRRLAFGAKTAILRDTFVADSLAEARRIAEEAVLGALDFANWRGPYVYLDPEEKLDPGLYEALTQKLTFDFVNERALLFGSPDDVVEKLVRLHEETNIEQVVFRCNWPGLDYQHTERSVRLLRDEVIPRVNDRIAGTLSPPSTAAAQ